MQRYGDSGLYTIIWLFSFLVCCDRHADLRQKRGLGSFFVGKGGAWGDLSTMLEMTFRLFHF
ncbi:hypothetical protein SAMN04487902_10511 [Prevotella sp. ne3005]|nr:hypothetical protein SAMN04487902_10511 [Prevotella sp. ne3005]